MWYIVIRAGQRQINKKKKESDFMEIKNLNELEFMLNCELSKFNLSYKRVEQILEKYNLKFVRFNFKEYEIYLDKYIIRINLSNFKEYYKVVVLDLNSKNFIKSFKVYLDDFTEIISFVECFKAYKYQLKTLENVLYCTYFNSNFKNRNLEIIREDEKIKIYIDKKILIFTVQYNNDLSFYEMVGR